MEFKKIKKKESHPLEDFFNMEEGNLPVEYEEVVPVPAVTTEDYDAKDSEIEDQIQDVYEAAMEQYRNTAADASKVEGRYKARNSEVAIQALNTALSAIKTRADIKGGKDKMNIQKGKIKSGPKELTQTNIKELTIVTDRNDLLKALEDKKDGKKE